MKKIFIISAFAFAACTDSNTNQTKVTETITTQEPKKTDTIVKHDTIIKKTPDTIVQLPPKDTAKPKVYSNKRFKDVIVKKIGNHKFQITGKAQIFEAAFSWVVEDGHNEIKKGFEMTDAGAPAFGKFSFTVDVAKVRANSTLLLILFESSAKDGSRQYELPVLLY